MKIEHKLRVWIKLMTTHMFMRKKYKQEKRENNIFVNIVFLMLEIPDSKKQCRPNSLQLMPLPRAQMKGAHFHDLISNKSP